MARRNGLCRTGSDAFALDSVLTAVMLVVTGFSLPNAWSDGD
jgi:hypothetical protein